MSVSLLHLHHRGPDERNIWCENGTVIGHCRLSIIDLSGSHQPMADPTNRYILSYNGEIYNYQTVRESLKDKWNFVTNGDTEVLLAGLLLEGAGFLTRLEGMWAFLLWDKLEQKALIARDRMGKKPLYYQYQNNSFSCASELPALSCLKEKGWQEDLDSTADYLRHGYYLPGTTAYQNVREVLPGHSLKWSPGKEIKQQPYWSLPVDNYKGTRRQAASELKETMIDAVRKRMVADVEVGAFLSGGVDSSLIVSILTNELNIKPKTFTIGFQEKSYDERKYAAQVAAYCGTDHYEDVLISWDRQKLTDLILNNIGQPFADSSLLPTSLVSEVASRHVKVSLSGDGGDELFSGYQRYQARNILRWYTRLPKPLRSIAAKMIRSMPEPMSHHSRSILKKAHLFQDIVDRIAWEMPYTAPVLYTENIYNGLVPELKSRGHSPPSLPEECNLDDIHKMMVSDAYIYLPQDILVKVDRASMAYSLEARAPFLDSKVVELAFSFPRKWHLSGMKGKKMLHESFQTYLPAWVWKRRKQGFAVPVYRWFMQDLGKELRQLVDEVPTTLNSRAVLHLLELHQSSRRDMGHHLWTIYLYYLWKSDPRSLLGTHLPSVG